MDLKEVYVGLGGNDEKAYNTLNEALRLLKEQPHIENLEVSRFYRTSPVSPIPQNDFINAVCRFKTNLAPHVLLKILQEIECKLGKVPKPKDAPRPIDCDLLFYGQESISSPALDVPHPRWRERLFVLTPLADLTDEINIPGLLKPIDLKKELKNFSNTHNENVRAIL